MSKVTVTELGNSISQAIRDGVKRTLTVVGEVSNPKVKGQHTYLTLKDAYSSIDVKFWRRQIKDSEAKHGDNVEITGKVEYYAPYNSMSFIGKEIEKVGIGSIHAQYEKTRKEYEKKGYFDNKKSMPKSIKNIGVVTAETGAALQDFIRVLRNNKFSGRVFVYDAWVQGPRCPDSVAAGVKFFDSPFYVNVDNRISNNITDQISDDSNSSDRKVDKVAKMDIDVDESSDDDSIDPFDPKFYGGKNVDIESERGYESDGSSEEDELDDDELADGEQLEEKLENIEELQDEFEQVAVDVVVVTRGGGSFEDLMGFSHSTVLEAIHKSKRYTISSVGHEIDDMLSDFAANCAVGTPSMAGDIISKTCSDGYEKLHEIEKAIMRYRQEIVRKLYSIRQDVVKIENGLEDPIKKVIKTIEGIQSHSKNLIWKSIKRYSRKNRTIQERISHHDSATLLKNGFSVLVGSDGIIIKDESQLFDQKIKLIHETGNYEVRIVRI
jgi:exonuclease VII large subunit